MPCSLLSRVYKTPHFNEYYKIPVSNVVCYDNPILYDFLKTESSVNIKMNIDQNL